MTKHVVCSECGKSLIADDTADSDNIVCNGCMPNIVKKARAYGGYIKAVEDGDIIVLNRKEIKELIGESGLWPIDCAYLYRFIEAHSNWRRKP